MEQTKKAGALSPAQKRKQQQKRQKILRAVLQLCFFFLTPSLFTGAFSGVKYIFTRIGTSQVLEPVSFVITLAALCGLTILFGRFFCGYVCAFGSLGDGVFYLSSLIQKKLRKKLPKMPMGLKQRLRYLPFLLLTVIILLCAGGAYGALGGWSPWDVFSMLTALNFRLGRYVLGLVLLVLILLGMAWEPRFFCRFLCPMGAVFRLLPIAPWSVLHRNTEQCIRGCTACTKNCPVELHLGEQENAGDCIRCDRCRTVCPKGNILPGIPALSRCPEAVTILKAVVYLVAAGLLGCLRFF